MRLYVATFSGTTVSIEAESSQGTIDEVEVKIQEIEGLTSCYVKPLCSRCGVSRDLPRSSGAEGAVNVLGHS